MKKKDIYKFLKEVGEKLPSIKIRKSEKFSDHNSIRVGGKIPLFVEIRDDISLIILLRIARKNNIPYFILGNGSNIICKDKKFDKLVIKISTCYYKISEDKLICSSGISLFKLNILAQKYALSGLEWSFGIPGTVGGAVKMNAGAFHKEMKDVVEKVYYTDGNKIYVLTNFDCHFSYRYSAFFNNNFVILRVVFSLKKSTENKIENKCFENLKLRHSTQPYKLFSAGCIFKKFQNTPAPIFIEQCNLKGLKKGGAEISKIHCGFIVNISGKAKFKDIIYLIKKIKKTVNKKFGIELQEEVLIL